MLNWVTNKLKIMKKIKEAWNILMMFIFILSTVIVASSCSNDDEDDYEPSSSGKVTISCTKGAKVPAQARYKYSVSVKYSGKADDVKVIGVHWGKGTTNQYASSATASKTSYSKTLELIDGIHYKIEGYVKLKTGQTITSKTTSVTP